MTEPMRINGGVEILFGQDLFGGGFFSILSKLRQL